MASSAGWRGGQVATQKTRVRAREERMTMTIGKRIEELRARAEAAAERFERARDGLLRQDGSPIYAEAEHAERLAALREERNVALREVEQELVGAVSEAQEDLAALENGDPASMLTGEELATANARRALAQDDVAGLAPEELITRLRAVRHGGDRGSMFAYALAARRRARAGDIGGSEADRLELTAVLEELGEAIVLEDRRAELEAARQRIRGADEVRTISYLAKNETTSLYNPNLAVPGPGR